MWKRKAAEMVQQVGMLAVRPDDPSLIPHCGRSEPIPANYPLTVIHTHAHTYTHTQAHTIRLSI